MDKDKKRTTIYLRVQDIEKADYIRKHYQLSGRSGAFRLAVNRLYKALLRKEGKQ